MLFSNSGITFSSTKAFNGRASITTKNGTFSNITLYITEDSGGADPTIRVSVLTAIQTALFVNMITWG